VYESQFGDLVVSEDVAMRVIGGKWRNLVIRKLEQLDEPVDGLSVP
jgi:DNA-binding HxlR family transcriptional regulator